MNYEIIIAVLVIAGGGIAPAAVWKFRHVFYVPEGQAGLVYQHGLFVRRNNVGRHVVWGSGWTIKLVDLRKAALLVPGQDILTADSVGLKVSVLVAYQVADPAKALHETQDWTSDVHNLAQLASRTVISCAPIETLLAQKMEIGAQLLARVQPQAAKIGINVLSVEVKDLMLPPDRERAHGESDRPK
ncbi:MAG TPA: SPFH domain-containing protein [Verrucomicrobiae bacterium]|jgi:regulator of protease activity HflC (stomatin/prohibitin superfamily)